MEKVSTRNCKVSLIVFLRLVLYMINYDDVNLYIRVQTKVLAYHYNEL